MPGDGVGSGATAMEQDNVSAPRSLQQCWARQGPSRASPAEHSALTKPQGTRADG